MFTFVKKIYKKNKEKIIEKKGLQDYEKRILDFKLAVKKCGEDLELFGKPELSFPQNIVIGDGFKVNDLVCMNGRSGIQIGDFVTISRGAKIISTGYDLDEFFSSGERIHITDQPVYIGDYCWICVDAIILPGVKITGTHVIVAAGAVVTKDITESRVIVAGNPAKIVKRMDESNAKC